MRDINRTGGRVACALCNWFPEDSLDIYSRRDKTREALASSFQTLLETRDYHDITVTEIAQQAGLSRLTFYNNFQARENLMDYLFFSMTRQIFANVTFDQNLNYSDRDCIEALADYICKRRDSLSRMIKSDTSYSLSVSAADFLNKVLFNSHHLKDLSSYISVPEKITCSIVAGSLVNTISSVLVSDTVLDRTAVANLLLIIFNLRNKKSK